MFIVVEIRDTLRYPAELFGDAGEARLLGINRLLSRKYCNRVIHNLGLCIAVHEILHLSDEVIYPNEGKFSVLDVDLNIIVFKPYVGEILTGKILKTTSSGIYLSTLFFDQIFVPKHYLPDNTRFNTSENTFVWKCGGPSAGAADQDEDVLSQDANGSDNPTDAEAGAAANLLYFDAHETVKFRIVAEIFHDLPPDHEERLAKMGAGTDAGKPGAGLAAAVNDDDFASLFAANPYTIIASMSEDGLGCTRWWNH